MTIHAFLDFSTYVNLRVVYKLKYMWMDSEHQKKSVMNQKRDIQREREIILIQKF